MSDLVGCSGCKRMPAVVHLSAGPDFDPDPSKPIFEYDLCVRCSIALLKVTWEAGMSKAGYQPWINRHRYE